MLYEVGILVMMLSCAFCGGSVWVPNVIALVGLTLMLIGRRKHNGKHTDTER